MRIYQLFHAVIDRFVPMDDSSKNELHIEASRKYQDLRADADRIILQNQQNIDWNKDNPDEEPKPLENLAVKHRVIKFLEQWWVRYIIAASFVFIVPKVKAIINGETGKDDDDDDGELGDFEAFQQFKRFKAGL